MTKQKDKHWNPFEEMMKPKKPTDKATPREIKPKKARGNREKEKT